MKKQKKPPPWRALGIILFKKRQIRINAVFSCKGKMLLIQKRGSSIWSSPGKTRLVNPKRSYSWLDMWIHIQDKAYKDLLLELDNDGEPEKKIIYFNPVRKSRLRRQLLPTFFIEADQKPSLTPSRRIKKSGWFSIEELMKQPTDPGTRKILEYILTPL
jgi:hypothetical protein